MRCPHYGIHLLTENGVIFLTEGIVQTYVNPSCFKFFG